MTFKANWKPGDLGHVADHNSIGSVLGALHIAFPGDNLQTKVDDLSKSGGGKLYISPGKHVITSPLILPSNIWLDGEGYSSKIYNDSTNGVNKIAVMAGNIDSPGNKGSAYNKTFVPFRSRPGDILLPVVGFLVGDVVFIRSSETFADNGRPLHVNQNIITAVGNGTITLKYPLIDTYTDGSGIAKLSGGIGIDGLPEYTPSNIHISNLRISNRIDNDSGWYCLFLSCIESTFENLYLDGSKGIGANCASYNNFRNIRINYQAAPFDLAYGCCGNLIDGLYTSRIGSKTSLGDLGISIHEEGSDNTLINFLVNSNGVEGTNGVSTWHNHRAIVANGAVLNSGGYGVLIAPQSEGCQINSVKVYQSGLDGIYVGGGRITDCDVYGHGENYHDIRIADVSQDYILRDNVGIVYDPRAE